MEVRNCKNCGRLFNYMGKTLCPECLKSREDEFQIAKDYIRNNPNCGVADVSEATGISVHQIRQWIREERLILTAASATAGINCESCGRPIQTGRLCAACKKQVSNELSHAFVKEPAASEAKKASDGDRMRYLSKKNL